MLREYNPSPSDSYVFGFEPSYETNNVCFIVVVQVPTDRIRMHAQKYFSICENIRNETQYVDSERYLATGLISAEHGTPSNSADTTFSIREY